MRKLPTYKVIPWNLVWLKNHEVSYGNLAAAKKHDISKAMYVCSYKTPNLKRTSYKNTGGTESRKHQKGNLIGKTVLQKPFEISVGSLTRQLCSKQQQNRTRKPRRGVHKNDISQDNLSTAFNNMKSKSMQQKQHKISWGKSITISLGGSNKASNVIRAEKYDISLGILVAAPQAWNITRSLCSKEAWTLPHMEILQQPQKSTTSNTTIGKLKSTTSHKDTSTRTPQKHENPVRASQTQHPD